ncbi:MAG: DUF5684 domain-containing protein [Candidatus Eiseniibacteriota bacterium]
MDESMATPEFTTGMMIGFAIAFVVTFATLWRIFSKAGEAGWKCLIPVYGAMVFQRILGRPAWWVALMLVPVANLAIAIIECFDLAKVFGKGVGYALGLIFLGPVYAMVLAFGPAKYVGPGGAHKRSAPRPVSTSRPTATTQAVSKAPIRKKAA